MRVSAGPDRIESSNDLDAVARAALADLHTPHATVFWSDLLLTACVGWAAFVAGVLATSPALILLSWTIAGLALYRGVCFTHELAHLRRRSLPGFETSWNILFGIPLLLPSFTYLGVHQTHHNLATYGTKDDPEYLPFASSRAMITVFAIQSTLLLPILIVVRFLVLAPLGLAFPPFHRWLEAHASSFAMNPAYRRDVSIDIARKMRRWEAVVLAVWIAGLSSIFLGWVPARALLAWLAVMVFISFLNTMRVLGAHEYETDGTPRSRYEQLVDSIDTPGGPWTELWAPVGLRYHALHHYFPGIPYHNLGAAYRRLTSQVPVDSPYHDSTSTSLVRSLRTLWAKAKRAGAALAASAFRHRPS